MIDPKIGAKIVAAISQAVERAGKKNLLPALLCSPTIRRHLRKLIERSLKYIPVLSQAEIPGNIQVEILEVIKLIKE